LHDNCNGDQLSTHTYFICPALAVFTYPLGAIGLLVALGLAMALNVWGIQRLLGILAVPRWLAGLFALGMTAMPFSVNNYQDRIFGFHVELLLPAMAVWLAYFLSLRSWRGTLLVALAMLSVKEDAPLTVALIASMVAGEDVVRFVAEGPARRRAPWLNKPALAVVILAIFSLVVCLFILQSQRTTGHSAGSFQRLQLEDGAVVTSGQALAGYVFHHLESWLNSTRLTWWIDICLAGTFGLIVVRPHYALLALVTTLVAWLMRDDQLWAPRFAPTLAFLQVAACLVLASGWQTLRLIGNSRWRVRATALALVVLGASLVWGNLQQWSYVPQTTEVYCLAPRLRLSPEELLSAQRVFASYRRDGRKDEPVIASDFLFRYAHDRNLFWADRLAGRPQPDWILWDTKAKPLAALQQILRTDEDASLANYDLVAVEDRFSLYRRKGIR
jgi:hypothetical protein